MGGPRTSAEVLLLSAVGVGPGATTSENSNTTAPDNGYQETCQIVNLVDATHRISSAVDSLTAELSCKLGKNGSFPQNRSSEVEQNLRQVVESTLIVILDLGINESGISVLDTFGVLDSLRLGNNSDLTFIRLWFSVKMAPLLSYVDESFLNQLSSQNFSCSSFQELIAGMSIEMETSKTAERNLIYTQFIQVYLSRKNLEVLELLSPNQKAELILNPTSGALEDVAIVQKVFASLTESAGIEQLSLFFLAFTEVTKQENITIIENPAVRETILNLTLTAIAPEFVQFGPQDFGLWFQVYLSTVMASLLPDSLVAIPSNISCASYEAILTGLQQSLTSLPLDLSQGVRSTMESFEMTFARCSVPDSFMCKETPVNENLICSGVVGLPLQQIENSSQALCNFTITQYACSSATNLTAHSLATLMKCSLEGQTTYPVEVWKLFFQKVSSVLDEALVSFATMAPNISSPSLSQALEALGEVKINNFSQTQLHTDAFVSSWFQTKARPFLASSSPNFLFCLSTKNLSCQTYQIVIQAFSSQQLLMDSNTQQAVFTYFIEPFLSRNDSSDPGCVSSVTSSSQWIHAFLGGFSGFATLQQLHALNPNFSSVDSLSVLTPAQVAELTIVSGALNDTHLMYSVFDRLEEGNAMENVDQFLTKLTADGQIPVFQPAVRDLAMNRTFTIISTYFPDFSYSDWIVWFHVKLVPLLPSFSPTMLMTVTSSTNCTTYRVVVSGLALVFPEIPLQTAQEITAVLLGYLKKSVAVIGEPACRPGNQNVTKWLDENLGPFLQFAPYADLKVFNISAVAVVGSLSPNQKAELILDPTSGALEDVAIVQKVFASLTESAGIEQLSLFFLAFTEVTKQENITIIENPAVRETILNLTLTAIAPEFVQFGPQDFGLWFQVYLSTVMASLLPDSLVAIPSNISCASYEAILTGLQQSLTSLPLDLSQGVRSTMESFEMTFARCSVPDSFMCKETPVNENLICSGVVGLPLQQIENSSQALCNFTITQYACSSATNLTAHSLATLMKCSLEGQTTYPVEVWKLFFQKVSSVLDEALVSFATMAPNISSPSLSQALEALGEVKINNFSQTQLHTDAFVSSWFQTKARPFLASSSPNFLFCLSTKNLSCQTYQIVIQAFSSQQLLMDSNTQQAVFTYFIEPFLSRNDSSDPGCVSSVTSSSQWIHAFLGGFSGFATLQQLHALNPNFSSVDSLSVLTPAQVAELTIVSGALNDTHLMYSVFDRLEEGNAMENVDQFLTKLTADGQIPVFQPAVRDLAMNRTFTIISTYFPDFSYSDWIVWFHVKLVPLLPSFSPTMLMTVTSSTNCTTYRVVVSGLALVFPEIPLQTAQEITAVLLGYLKKSVAVIGEPACRPGNQNVTKWLDENLGPFLQFAPYADLKVFNISAVAVVGSLSPNQKAELILDPTSGALEDVAIVQKVFASLTESAGIEQLSLFFLAFTEVTKQENITIIENPAVRETILNLTLTAIAPEFVQFGPQDFGLWFQVYLSTVMASLLPDSLVAIPSNISCASYEAILTGLQQSLTSLPLDLSQGVRSTMESFEMTFARCSVPDSFMCKETPVNENLICSGVVGLPLQQIENSSQALCNFTITQYACSSATNLTAHSLATLMKCSLEGQTTYPVEVWKLFFQKVSSVLDEALVSFATMAPNISSPSLSQALEALGEVKINNFSQTQLHTDAFVSSWFQTKARPFLASSSPNFLFCLSTKNLSCQTYQIVIQAFSSQQLLMDSNTQQAVFTYFIEPFLSRNDSSDPGCVSSVTSSSQWIHAFLGGFSGFATLQQLHALNPNFSSVDSLSVLTPAQVAELTIVSGALNDTHLMYSVFDRLEEGNAMENVDQFLTKLTADGQIPVFQPAVRDLAMNRTFTIISTYFPDFSYSDWIVWFHVKLVPLLPSFSPTMLMTVTSSTNCTTYRVVVSGLAVVFPEIPLQTAQEITAVLLGYLKKSVAVIGEPGKEQLISVDPSPAAVVVNVPDALATEIPPVILTFPDGAANISVLNNKQWTQTQASMFFGELAKSNFDTEQLSPPMLQGFTCTSVQKMTATKIQNLIYASRPRTGRAKVELKESQLTCMYNLLNGTISQNFTDYPSDMLLYFKTKDIKPANCRSYYSAMGAADFSVASSVLNKGSLLLSEAKSCLGINGFSLSRDNVNVLGNMACTLDSSYILNADPLILEKLKVCKSFSASQVAAMETLLLSGNTQYGPTSTWNQQTLTNLGILPLYLTSNFWSLFQTTTKKGFLQTFMPQLRKANTDTTKLKALFTAVSTIRMKRGAGCTTDNITQVVVSNPSFPFGYDLTQFDLCLDISVLTDNLNSICQKVDDSSFQAIILAKLNQAFPSGLADSVVQVLSSVSRVASLNDISKWNITKIDTLAALMTTSDGPWDAAKSNAIITKYLNTSGNSLGSAELNSIGSNLCSLNTSTLTTITPDSIKNANPLKVLSCSTEQKQILYGISNVSFSSLRGNSSLYYNLIKPTLGGAPLSDVVTLSTQNINMDIATFQSLDPNVISNLTVTNVKGLLGNQLPDLKLFENDTIIQSWLNKQLQSDLDTLGLGLTTTRTTSLDLTGSTTSTSTPTSTSVSSTSSTSMLTSGSTVTSTQGSVTNVGTALANHPSTIFLTIVLTTVMQILQHLA
ncbi:uncharacterized protein LOC113158540 [Anabas testudineus]|uniref:uncharacterized protein LOC113158540 n=1 Tax=Anabas testudineus TaxID=64144 RepID=UPI000E45AE08|nr:uncharacterized protein LOC113158540 [Anabas testudineus]